MALRGREETRRVVAGAHRPTLSHQSYIEAHSAATRLYYTIRGNQPVFLNDAVLVIWVAELREPDPCPCLFEGSLVAFYASKWETGRRIVHLLYPWELMDGWDYKQPDWRVFTRCSQPGEILRARIRYARWRTPPGFS